MRDRIEAGIMKYYALSHKYMNWQIFRGRFCNLRDQTELLDEYSLTNTT